MDFSKATIDCSSIVNIMGGSQKGITEKQLERLEYLQTKDTPITDKQAQEISDLSNKRDFVVDLELSEGCKSHLIDMYCLHKGKRRPSYMGAKGTVLKGTQCEEEALQAITEISGKEYCVDKRKVFNEFLSGRLDGFIGESVENANKIIDVKCSWDMPTFYQSLRDELSSAYEYQMQGYMSITGAELADVAFVLVNTPEILLEEEYKKVRRRLNLSHDDPEFLLEKERIRAYHTYDEIPLNERICIFTVERNAEKIENIHKKVAECRKWLQTFHNIVLERTKNGQKRYIPS